METQYLDLMRRVLDEGVRRDDRTGVGTLSTFGAFMRHDLSQGFPLLTTKRIHFKSVVAELVWLLSGSTRVADLQALGCTIWDEWADEIGSLGPVYGKQWRGWDNWAGNPIDQVQQLVQRLRTDPDSRRHVVSAWNVADLPDMALVPCHFAFQVNARPLTGRQRILYLCQQMGVKDRRIRGRLDEDACHVVANEYLTPRRALDLQVHMRSVDVFLGLPFNLASYALLCHLIARTVNMVPGVLSWTGGDVHLYTNHLDQAREQLSRVPRSAPRLVLDDGVGDLLAFRPDQCRLDDYDPWPAIKADVAV